MKASEIVKELQHVIETDGDYEVDISCIALSHVLAKPTLGGNGEHG